METMTATTEATKQLTKMSHEEFYQTLITRNALVIDDKTQAMFKNGKFLVAGCGSIGGAIVEPLVRIGAERFNLAEPDGFELSNINRQQMRFEDVGVNKAVAVWNQARAISPFAQAKIFDRGIQDDNIDQALDGVSVVFDGIDVTTPRPILIKFKLHEAAKAKGIPVISGYDVAGLQMLAVYRYDLPGTKVMHGKVTRKDFEKAGGLKPMDFLFKVVPLKCIPAEIFPAVQKMLAGEQIGFPQVVYTARSYGNMALAAAVEVMNRRPTRKYVIFDHTDAVRPWWEQMRMKAVKWVGLTGLLFNYFKTR